MDPAFLVLAGIVLVAQAAAAVSGFGATVIVLTLGAHLYAIPELLVMVLPLSLCQSLWIVSRHHRAIRWRLLAGEVLPLMGVGLAAGFLLSDQLDSGALRTAFAALVLVLSLRELWLGWRGTAGTMPLPRVAYGGFLVGAGVIHGIWATGGPPLVYALGRRGLDKTSFRSTLCMVWICLDSAYNTRLAIGGHFSRASLSSTAALLPAVVIGLWLGERLHARIDERRFRLFAFTLLALAAASLLAV